ncbi:MAG: nucleoside monophosphate kinase [Limnothrix sp. RL_2_0]|nr:nucleoside monophosphate kinase [Limnothrix sp. RL_2_0]
MRLIILGGSGAGKSTQAKKVCAALNLQLVSVGEILRSAIANRTALGKQAEAYVIQGKLIPDELMIQFMGDRLSQPDMAAGWILEGYPRTAFQAEELDFLLDGSNQTLDWAIYLQVADELLLERSQKRGLPDDTPEILEQRLKAFHESTVPILEYYSHRQKLLTIDTAKPISEITETLIQCLSNS